MYRPLDKDAVLKYVRESPLLSGMFDADAHLIADDLSDGNINLIFSVSGVSGTMSNSVLLKQALPHARRYPEVKIPLDRARLEFEALQIERKYCPDLVPHVYLHDAERHLNVMEHISRHSVLRAGLLRGIVYPSLGAHLGRFLARTLFYTSDLYLPSAEKKMLVQAFINPALCKITEDLVFTEPYVTHPNNRCNRRLDDMITAMRGNKIIRSEVMWLKRKFMCDAQALIHGDLHTGSVLVNEDETKVIDPEFAYVGPMGFDIGTVVAHLTLSYAFHNSGAVESQQLSSYRSWLLEVIREVWQVMEEEFRRLWESEGGDQWLSASFQEKYFRELLADAAGFAACEVVRRIVGLAHVPDLENIQDPQARASAEKFGLTVARTCLLERSSFRSIDDVVSVVAQAVE